MTHHQAKRQYNGSQPQITSFFSHSSASPLNQLYSISQHQDEETQTAQLPASVQSNLLAVGMRVRKSVPEGYKTGSEYSAFELFSDNYKPIHSQHEVMEVPRAATKTRPRANAGAGVRELMPFCGLLKVGGMNTQQWGIYQPQTSGAWSRYDAGNEEAMHDEDDVPCLSQGSTITNASFDSLPATPNGSKRRCEWDDSGDEIAEEYGEKRSSGVALSERVLAVPRRRKYQGSVGKVGVAGQENKIFGVDMDFGEADFLDIAALKGEVEMTDA